MNPNIIEFQDVDFYRGELPILESVNCQIQKGERVALFGSSGSGKTTFLRLCAGLERVNKGHIFLRGVEVSGPGKFTPPGERKIGFVFQNYALFEKVKVLKNILYGCKTLSDKEEAYRLIKLMDLSQHLEKWPMQLSGGERQKVALARSLALRPDIILLDEPFASLDPEQSRFLIGEMKTLFSRLNVTAVMVTHSEEEAHLFAQRIFKFPMGK